MIIGLQHALKQAAIGFWFYTGEVVIKTSQAKVFYLPL